MKSKTTALLSIGLLLVGLAVGCTIDQAANLITGKVSRAPFESKEGLAVLMVFDPAPDAYGALSENQKAIVNEEGKVRKWCMEHCYRDPQTSDIHFRAPSPANPMDRDLRKFQQAKAAEHPAPPYMAAAGKGGGGFMARIEPDTSPDAVIKRLQAIK